ncbi:MAG: NADH-quinone oxidoreductase subunit N, partial [candidate division Zixibacteria bacterium]|nr:NADH-quinone oxidoreductase subunit N [candidate division Zixibacteria bacterium]
MLNLDNASIDFGLLLPEIILCVAGFAILLLGVSIRNRAINLPLSVLALGLALFFSVADWGNASTGFFGLVSKDSFSAIYNLIFLISGIISLLIAKSYLESRGIDRPEFYALILFSIVGMMIMASSFDLIVIFLGLEIMSIPLYVLAGFEKDNPKSNEASIKYFIMGAFATGFLLYGIAMIYGAAGTTDLRIIAENFQTLKLASPLFIYTGAALALVGFAFKVAAVPFHMWAPDVYEGAPTPVVAFLSVASKAAAFAVVLRVLFTGFFDVALDWGILIAGLAAASMVIGNLVAISQSNIRRLFGYSTISHAGYILVGVAAGVKSGDGIFKAPEFA